jgi:hypothetical protein
MTESVSGALKLAGFVALWSLGNVGMAYLSGWVRLAHAYRVRRRPTGRPLRWRSGILGSVGHGGILNFWVAPEGLYLKIHILFRPGNPPLLIPWPDIHVLRRRDFLFARRYEVEFGLTGVRGTFSRSLVEEWQPHIALPAESGALTSRLSGPA